MIYLAFIIIDIFISISYSLINWLTFCWSEQSAAGACSILINNQINYKIDCRSKRKLQVVVNRRLSGNIYLLRHFIINIEQFSIWSLAMSKFDVLKLTCSNDFKRGISHCAEIYMAFNQLKLKRKRRKLRNKFILMNSAI